MTQNQVFLLTFVDAEPSVPGWSNLRYYVMSRPHQWKRVEGSGRGRTKSTVHNVHRPPASQFISLTFSGSALRPLPAYPPSPASISTAIQASAVAGFPHIATTMMGGSV